MNEALFPPVMIQDFGQYKSPETSHATPYKILAEGDSWFSVGAFAPWKTANILVPLRLPQHTSVVNCASPGHTLQRMVDWAKNPEFEQAISPDHLHSWSAILLSAGGNDLVAATRVRPIDADGNFVEPEKRLLRTEDERHADGGPDRYLSEQGWQQLHDHLLFWIGDIMGRVRQRRDAVIPVFLHTYDYPFPVDTGGDSLGAVLTDYKVPQEDWYPVSQVLINRLARTLQTACKSHQGLYLIECRGLLVDPSQWEDEMHPTAGGYRRIARQFTRALMTYGPYTAPIQTLARLSPLRAMAAVAAAAAPVSAAMAGAMIEAAVAPAAVMMPVADVATVAAAVVTPEPPVAPDSGQDAAEAHDAQSDANGVNARGENG